MTIDLLLVDGLNLIRRVHAGGSAAGVSDTAGVVDACAQSLRRALRETRPSHAAVVLDGSGRTWRHELDPDYKAERKPMPEEVRAALPGIEAAFTAAGVRSISLANTEADDVIASIASKIAAAGGDARILSTDRAFLSLLSPRIAVRDHFARQDLGREDVVRRFGLPPERLVDLWALSGYPSNGIAGVPGIGPKTALALLAEHGDLEGVLAVAGVLPGRAGRALREHAEAARHSLELAALRSDLEVGVNLRELRLP